MLSSALERGGDVRIDQAQQMCMCVCVCVCVECSMGLVTETTETSKAKTRKIADHGYHGYMKIRMLITYDPEAFSELSSLVISGKTWLSGLVTHELRNTNTD